MYVVSLGQGKIYKTVPTAELDMSASAGSLPSVPLTAPDTTVPSGGEVAGEDTNGGTSDQTPGNGLDGEDEGNDNNDNDNGNNDNENGDGGTDD